MVTRTLSAVLLALMVVGLVAGPVMATEGEESHFTEYSEIRENASDVSAEFLTPDAEDAERPGFFDWMIYPLAAAGVLVAGFVIMQYLVFQPRFAREAEARSKR